MHNYSDFKNVLVVDVETTGLDPINCGLLSIGAVWLEDFLINPIPVTFYIEMRIISSAYINGEALKLNGFTLEQCFDQTKPSEIQGVKDFIEWVESTKNCPMDKIVMAGHNLHLDRAFIQYRLITKNSKSSFENWLFNTRMLDLHATTFAILGKSMKSSEICEILGIPEEPKPHNALSGAISEARCFKELLFK